MTLIALSPCSPYGEKMDTMDPVMETSTTVVAVVRRTPRSIFYEAQHFCRMKATYAASNGSNHASKSYDVCTRTRLVVHV